MKRINYKKIGFNLLFTTSFLFIIFGLLACGAGITMPEPKSDNDAILVIVKEYQKLAGSAGPFYYFEMSIQNIEGTIKINAANNEIFIDSLPPGKYTTTELLIKRVSRPGYESSSFQPKPFSFKVTFTLKPGCITVFPVKFIFFEKKEASGDVYSDFDLVKIDEEEKKQILQRLKNTHGTFSLWCNELNIK